ncbi:MAG: LysM domain, partial [Candidatus Eisenbacteria bacterium]
LGAKGQPKRGTTILVSGESTADASVLESPATDGPRGRAHGATAQRTHLVRQGETLESIARRHGVTVQQLRRANKMTSSRVQAGQRLKLPA